MRTRENNISKEQISASIERLQKSIPKGSRVAFYPSAGIHIEQFDFSNLPLDYIICSDYDVKEFANDKIVSVKADNNLCMRLIIESGIKLDAFFAVQDGAIQGGNYEFVNSIMFLGRLLPALNNEFVLVSNISNYFDFYRGPIKKIENPDIKLYRSAVYSTYNTNVANYDIQKFEIINYKSHQIKLNGKRAINIYRKSIWQDETQLDAIFKGGVLQREALKGYWPKSYMPDKLFNVFDLTPDASIIPLLELANKKQFTNIGLVPFVAKTNRDNWGNHTKENEKYSQLIKDFESWEYEYPQTINLYHFDKNDFEILYSL